MVVRDDDALMAATEAMMRATADKALREKGLEPVLSDLSLLSPEARRVQAEEVYRGLERMAAKGNADAAKTLENIQSIAAGPSPLNDPVLDVVFKVPGRGEKTVLFMQGQIEQRLPAENGQAVVTENTLRVDAAMKAAEDMRARGQGSSPPMDVKLPMAGAKPVELGKDGPLR